MVDYKTCNSATEIWVILCECFLSLCFALLLVWLFGYFGGCEGDNRTPKIIYKQERIEMYNASTIICVKCNLLSSLVGLLTIHHGWDPNTRCFVFLFLFFFGGGESKESIAFTHL